MKEKKEIEELSAEEALTEFKKGKKVRVAPPRKKDRMSLYNLRIENETLDRLLQLSNREGKPASALAREILSEGLRSRLSDEEHFTSTAYDEVVLEQAYGYLQLVSSQGLHTPGRSYRVRPSSPYFRTSGDFKPGQSSIPEENEVR